MAGKIEGHLNRKLARVAGDVAITTGGCASWIVPRYPLEAITGLDVRDTAAAGWVDSLLALDSYNPEAGTVYFSASLDYAQLRVTYTGGFWWETAEPADDGYPTAQPAGAAALPDAIRTAWLVQCEHVWRRRDKLGISIGQTESDKPAPGLTDLNLVPLVVEMLREHIRYALT